MRTEQHVFQDLQILCGSPGYVHVIAYFCWRDNTISFDDSLLLEDVLKLHTAERLIRTEMSTLIGLMMKSEITCKLPSPDAMQLMIDKTETLLNELHEFMIKDMTMGRDNISLSKKPERLGIAWREPIFYGGESAYASQYRDLGGKRYAADNSWIYDNKGFTVKEAVSVFTAISEFQNHKIAKWMDGLENTDPDELTALPCFMVEVLDLSKFASIPVSVIQSVFSAFASESFPTNLAFKTVGDFNAFNAKPILKVDDEKYLVFMLYSVYESFYESPFFWFLEDQKYKKIADKNRGDFTENFAAERLALVFGTDKVHLNVNVFRGTTLIGEIDVLVVYADRVIIIQAKAKKLTIDARKGNDNRLRSDFKAAIQDAYDQGELCAKALLDASCHLQGADRKKLTLRGSISKIHICTLLAENYPALAYQTRDFLKYKTTEIIDHPFVMDVFLLDVLCEMLQTPLRFMDYLERRAKINNRIMATHELTVLSYHLTNNLFVDDKADLLQLGDDVSADLESAILTRREGLPGTATPPGVMTHFKDTTWGNLISSIESDGTVNGLDLGCMLLDMGHDIIVHFNSAVKEVCKASRQDRMHHDAVMAYRGGGVTIHCNEESDDSARKKLEYFCLRRKYQQRAKKWFGICFAPDGLTVRFFLTFNFAWEYSSLMESNPIPLKKGTRTGRIGDFKFDLKKIGRNESCPCGSRKKFKNCCIDTWGR
ncbi:SEC-C domain-containing protein [Pseudomonas atacamensis]|uniref:SEC-C metal-binding domain-containing protein n=1 Tax=Pseudomonas atacamensis TaxID=2565368 RepID=UPI00215E4097|nr:SEC-C metal-binding domain-containing protein [Pseudomonas atacamensis]UVL15908.1 SEC-C domain-containing protein [Pseudomonas atacamensis]